MLAHVFGVALDILLFPAPPGWNAYVDLLEHALDFLANTFHSAGLAIVAFTIIIKTLLLPLTITSIRSSKAMQELQPKIKELQKKYGKDRARLSQETMRLYQQHRINPMAGCLPMLIQIPIFFGLYRAIVHLSGSDAGHWQDSFLWIPSLDEPDPWKILPIVAGAFQFIQTKMMRPAGQGKVTDPQQAMMNQLMNFMPITVILFGWTFAAGPVLYWATQSLYSVVQQWLITGWGSLRDWFPNLPELPEHRRLGYRPPRNLDDVVVVSGEEAVQPRGLMGWVHRKMEEAQQQQAARRAATSDAQRRVDEVTQADGKPSRPVKKEVRAASKRRSSDGGAAERDEVAASAGSSASGSTNGLSGPILPRTPRSARKGRRSQT
ncbi:MAG TPA: YidC/Oxa1 family membrane protein insertase [Thermomicrobiales bacterium]